MIYYTTFQVPIVLSLRIEIHHIVLALFKDKGGFSSKRYSTWGPLQW